MAKVINLSRVRQRKAKEAEKQRAATNVVNHGLSKQDRYKTTRERELEQGRLAGKRLDGRLSGEADAEAPAERSSVVPFRQQPKAES